MISLKKGKDLKLQRKGQKDSKRQMDEWMEVLKTDSRVLNHSN